MTLHLVFSLLVRAACTQDTEKVMN